MLFNSKKPTRSHAANHQRAKLVRKMATTLETTARERLLSALEVANFQIFYYSRKLRGTPCFCLTEDNDFLDEFGNMTDIGMQIVLNSPNYNRQGFQVLDYGEGLKHHGNVSLYETEPDPDDLATEYAETDELEDAPDNTDIESIYAQSTTTYSGTSCPLCMKTGIIGGFDLVQGKRTVIPVKDITILAGASFGESEQLPLIEATEGMNARLLFPLLLPKGVRRIKSFRLMNLQSALPSTDWKLFANSIQLNRNKDLIKLCDGEIHQLELQFSNADITHIDIEMLVTVRPLRVDISELSKSSGLVSLNQFDSITVVLPPTLREVKRGDVFFEKDSQSLWQITSVQMIRSSRMLHGWSVTAEPIRSSVESYSLHNPY